MQNPQTFRRAFLLAIAGIVAVGAVSARRTQAPDPKRLAFDVASIKPSKSVESGERRVPAGRPFPGR